MVMAHIKTSMARSLPYSGESTTTECGVNCQLLTIGTFILCILLMIGTF